MKVVLVDCLIYRGVSLRAATRRSFTRP
jgi:hypothetical protein